MNYIAAVKINTKKDNQIRAPKILGALIYYLYLKSNSSII